MAKIFDVQDWLKNHPNRNNFDLTHKVHGSYQFGKLYPVLCKPVVPTDTFRIDTAVSLRFTPMPFPTQSNMRVIFHYFYVRNKNIWKNWSNWLQGLEEHTPPYILKSKSFYSRGSLADYLDIPSGYHIGKRQEDVEGYTYFADNRNYNNSSEATVTSLKGFTSDIFSNPIIGMNIQTLQENFSVDLAGIGVAAADLETFTNVFVPFYFSTNEPPAAHEEYTLLDGEVIKEFYGVSFPDVSVSGTELNYTAPWRILYYDTHGTIVAYDMFYNVDGVYEQTGFFTGDASSAVSFVVLVPYSSFKQLGGTLVDPPTVPFYAEEFSFVSVRPAKSFDFGELDTSAICPYYCQGDSSNPTNKIKVSALPFRAYESIYNAFYRNSQGVQPFKIDGVTQYNKYVSNDGDGPDYTDYTLYSRNWELDAYTSCLISPQQGNVPYVGITDISALGRMSVQTPDGHEASVRLSDNGDGVEIQNLNGETQEARAYALRAASSGFTIPEFREANALQRFLEMNIRKGYKYIDFIEGHFGKKPTYAEMDMPEFIGGFSQRISVNEISNTNGVANDTLGAIAGQARAIGGSKHGINHYFDDFGFVVGIMCIVPDNAYDCILPKHYNLKEPLDAYFPEFAQLSYMPITHEELAPVQTVNDPRGDSYHDVHKVFGYQRPNHDLVWYPDSVHGLFRDATGIGDSIICRRFGQRPDLSNDFLTIKPSETDTIFNYTFGDNDICLGEVVLSIKAKRPVPRLVVPTIS